MTKLSNPSRAATGSRLATSGRRSLTRAAVIACASLALWAAATVAPANAREASRWSLRHHAPAVVAEPPTTFGSVILSLDDGSREADFGVSGVTASQYLWFNQFAAPPGGIDLDEIQVLFPAGPEIVPGAPIQLAVFSDDDGDPTNGADLLATFSETVQFADGVTFSTYFLGSAVAVPAGTRDILIGVINRFVASGVSPPSRPSALDTTTSAGRSWLALWTGDPPAAPELPSDDFLDLIDFLEPGNWMIRAAGTAPPVTEVPTVSSVGLAILVALLGLGGAIQLRRARELRGQPVRTRTR